MAEEFSTFSSFSRKKVVSLCPKQEQNKKDMGAIKRTMQSEIEKRLKAQKVMLLFGARRVGKTILLRQIVEGWQKGKTLLLNGESMDTARILENKTTANYRRMFSGISLLAIDEAQHIPDIGMKLKFIVDELPDIAVIATGSSSFELHNQAGEPLVGRSTQFMLTPLSEKEISSEENTGWCTGTIPNCWHSIPTRKRKNILRTWWMPTCCATLSW